jgi:GTPase SAR1 family protein
MSGKSRAKSYQNYSLVIIKFGDKLYRKQLSEYGIELVGDYVPLDMVHKSRVMVNEEEVELRVISCVEDHGQDVLDTEQVRSADGFLYVFPVDNLRRFEVTREWKEWLQQAAEEDKPFFMIGMDLDTDSREKEGEEKGGQNVGHQTRVTPKEAQKLASEFKTGYSEINPKTKLLDINSFRDFVTQAFHLKYNEGRKISGKVSKILTTML